MTCCLFRLLTSGVEQVVTRCDCNSHTYCVDILPRAPKSAGLLSHGSEYTYREFGRCLLQAVLSNGGVPPIGVAYDAATAHVSINRAFLGLASASELQDAEFFDQCKVKKIKLKCFSFGCLFFQDGTVYIRCYI